MARSRPSRISNGRVLQELRTAARKGDRAALTLALDQMRTLALSPRYWEKYLALLGNPLARLVDLLVIKQGERIARQKGWKNLLKGASTAPSKTSPRKGLRRRSRRSKSRPRPTRRGPTGAAEAQQQLLFELPPRA